MWRQGFSWVHPEKLIIITALAIFGVWLKADLFLHLAQAAGRLLVFPAKREG